MIKITTVEVIPFANIYSKQKEINNFDSSWLRWAINQLYNRVKGSLKHDDILTNVFHNHDENTQQTIVRYPLIQFVAKDNRLMTTCINEGCDAMKALLEQFGKLVKIDIDTYISFVQKPPENMNICIGSSIQHYRISNYLPFNTDTYSQYTELRLLKEKIALIKGQLYKHIVKDFAKHLSLNLDGIRVEIVDVNSFTRNCVQLPVNKRKRDYQPFDIVFETNATLPPFICLGVGKAYGFGLLES